MINLEIILAVIGTTLTLANVFQWFDRRSKNKALQSFLEAIHDMAKRLEEVDSGSVIKQKSQDLCSVVNAAIVTVGGSNKSFIQRLVEKTNK
ncbi:MAG: hypothetical protein Q8N42_02250 [bacterium]|nr:hypothetical protein [bacterium]